MPRRENERKSKHLALIGFKCGEQSLYNVFEVDFCDLSMMELHIDVLNVFEDGFTTYDEAMINIHLRWPEIDEKEMKKFRGWRWGGMVIEKMVLLSNVDEMMEER